MASALDLLKATIWSRRLLILLNKDLVFGNLFNRNYEGEIRQNQSVKISRLGRVQVATYTPNQDINDPPVLTADQQTMTIDKFDYTNFQVDHADRALMDINVFDSAVGNAGYELAQKVDGLLGPALLAAAQQQNIVDFSAADAVKTDPYDQITEVNVRLNELNVPRAGRYIVLPPWVAGLIRSDDRFTDLSKSGQNTLATGEFGNIGGCRILESNNQPTQYMTLGLTEAATFANAMDEAEVYRLEKRFADAFKALHIYGFKIPYPEMIGAVKLSRKITVMGGWVEATNAPLNTLPAAGGTAIHVRGGGFKGRGADATGVTFGGTAGTAFSVIDDQNIHVTTPAKAAGTYDLVVVKASGNGTLTGGVTYV